MKVSIILPTLYPRLAERAYKSIVDHGATGVELEVIYVSPTEPCFVPAAGANVTWVQEEKSDGNCSANRRGLQYASGDIIACLADDITLAPGWLKTVGHFLESMQIQDSINSHPIIVGLAAKGIIGTCFGRYYANFPLFYRSALTEYPKIADDFYPPYVKAHWGDVAFSLGVWRNGGRVLRCPTPLVTFETDRLGYPEAAPKLHQFKADTAAFLTHCSVTEGGWPTGRPADFNIDTTDRMIEHNTVFVPDYKLFMSRLQIAGGPRGLWVMPTHKRAEKCQRTLNAIMATGCTTPGIVFVNGPPENHEPYMGLKLPIGWSVLFHDDDVPVCDMYRLFFQRNLDLDWYGVIPDDVVPKTHNWDTRLVQAAGTRRIASANDEWQAPNRMHGATVYGGELVRALGYFPIPGLKHMYFDDQWECIGRELKCWDVLMDVITTHEHYGNGKAEKDESYQRSEQRLFDGEDQKVFQEWFGRRMDEYKRLSAVTPVVVRQINVDHLRGKKVMIATPCHGGELVWQYVASLFNTLKTFNALGIEADMCFVPGESLIQRARNALLKIFDEQSTCDWLWLIDSDMGWQAQDIIRMMAFGKDIIAAAGCRKADPISFCVNFGEPPIVPDPETGLVRVNEVGTGCMLISRNAMTKMMAAWRPMRTYTDLASGLKYVGLFEVTYQGGVNPPETGLLWSEDYTFCQRARALGFDVWCDPHIVMSHVGLHEWKGSLFDWMMEQHKQHLQNVAEAQQQAQPLVRAVK